jgi:hypothetical protein
MNINGMQVIVSDTCLAETTERNFSLSRHRSRRVYKKLVKRFQGEFRKEPAMFQIQGKLYVHPARYQELKEQINALQ